MAQMNTTTGARRRGRPRKPVARETFLAAARELFARDGFRGARLAEIAEAAGVTKAAVVHHFGSKQGLYEQTLEAIAGDLGALVLEAISEPGDFLGRVDRLGDRVTHYLGNNPLSARLLVRELVDGGQFLGAGGEGLVEAALDAAAALIAAGIEEGVIADQDPGQLAGTIVSLHMMWFAAMPMAKRLSGGEPLSEREIEARAVAVRGQVRRLLGAPPASVGR